MNVFDYILVIALIFLSSPYGAVHIVRYVLRYKALKVHDDVVVIDKFPWLGIRITEYRFHKFSRLWISKKGEIPDPKRMGDAKIEKRTKELADMAKTDVWRE